MIILGFAAGAAVAHTARGPLARAEDPLRTRWFAVVGLLACGAYAPAAVVTYGQYPDWSLMYFVDPAQLPLALMLPVVLVFGLVAPPLGYLAVWRGRAAGAEASRVPLAVAVAVLVLTVGLGAGRLASVAWYDDFHHGGPRVPLADSPLLWVLVLSLFFVSFATLFSLAQLRPHVRRLEDASRAPLPPSDAQDTVDGAVTGGP